MNMELTEAKPTSWPGPCIISSDIQKYKCRVKEESGVVLNCLSTGTLGKGLVLLLLAHASDHSGSVVHPCRHPMGMVEVPPVGAQAVGRGVGMGAEAVVEEHLLVSAVVTTLPLPRPLLHLSPWFLH